MKLRELRIQKALTQKVLAEQAGIAAVTVAAIERGVQLPTLSTGRKLAETLGVEPNDIEEVQQAIERELKKDLVGTSPTR